MDNTFGIGQPEADHVDNGLYAIPDFPVYREVQNFPRGLVQRITHPLVVDGRHTTDPKFGMRQNAQRTGTHADRQKKQ